MSASQCQQWKHTAASIKPCSLPGSRHHGLRARSHQGPQLAQEKRCLRNANVRMWLVDRPTLLLTLPCRVVHDNIGLVLNCVLCDNTKISGHEDRQRTRKQQQLMERNLKSNKKNVTRKAAHDKGRQPKQKGRLSDWSSSKSWS